MENVALATHAVTANGGHVGGPAVTSSSDTALQFISCHHFIGSFCHSSSSAHWHQEIEIIHCISGEGFTHICQGKSEEFNAPAIVIVPSNLIHRTTYPPHCRVIRIKFSPEVIRLFHGDSALDSSMVLLKQGALRGSIVIGAHDTGFDYISALVAHLEELVSPLPASEQRISALTRDCFNAPAANGKGKEEDTTEEEEEQEHNGGKEPAMAAPTVTLTATAPKLDEQVTPAKAQAEAQQAQAQAIAQAATLAGISAGGGSYGNEAEHLDRMSHRATLEAEALAAAAAAALFGNADSEPTAEQRLRAQEAQQAQQAHAEAVAQFADFARKQASSGATPDSSSKHEESALDGAPANDDFGRSNAINAGSITIAYASTRNYKNQSGSDNSPRQEEQELERKRLRVYGLTLQVKASLLHLIGSLFEYGYLIKEESGRRQRMSRVSDDNIKELLNYIHANYNCSITISELSGMLQVTNQYFCRIFKQLTALSFIDYINEFRLQKAAIDIATTADSIRGIGMQHGFDTIGYFFKLFREHYHTTPVKFRKSFLGSDGLPLAQMDYNNGLVQLPSLLRSLHLPNRAASLEAQAS